MLGCIALRVPIVQRPRTWPFQGQNTGSNPVGDATAVANSSRITRSNAISRRAASRRRVRAVACTGVNRSRGPRSSFRRCCRPVPTFAREQLAPVRRARPQVAARTSDAIEPAGAAARVELRCRSASQLGPLAFARPAARATSAASSPPARDRPRSAAPVSASSSPARRRSSRSARSRCTGASPGFGAARASTTLAITPGQQHVAAPLAMTAQSVASIRTHRVVRADRVPRASMIRRAGVEKTRRCRPWLATRDLIASRRRARTCAKPGQQILATDAVRPARRTAGRPLARR